MFTQLKPIETTNFLPPSDLGASLGEGIYAQIETIDPNQATRYLQQTGRNRNLNAKRVSAYAHDICSGQWLLSPQMIAFDSQNKLIDGQHRLHAIIRSGVACKLIVMRGFEPNTMKVIDSGQRRTLAQAFQVDGADVTTNMIATARAMRSNPTVNRFTGLFTNQDDINLFYQHEAAIRFATRKAHSKSCRVAAIRAVLARAWYTQDRDRLDQFINCLDRGIYNGESDIAAILLRNHWINSAKESYGSSTNIEWTQRTYSAVKAFLEQRPLSRLMLTTSDYFPVKTLK